MLKLISAIMAANPSAQLTGSRALELQGFKVRKAPKDVDIWIPDGTPFNLIPGMSYPKTKKQLDREKLEADLLKAPEPTPEKNESYIITRDVLTNIIRDNPSKRTEIFKALGSIKAEADRLSDFEPKHYGTILVKLSLIPDMKIDTRHFLRPAVPVAVPAEQPVKQAVEEDYGDEGARIVRYEMDGVKIEVHTGRQNEIRKPWASSHGFNCSEYRDILQAKMRFINPNSPTTRKHSDDIVFFFVANFY